MPRTRGQRRLAGAPVTANRIDIRERPERLRWRYQIRVEIILLERRRFRHRLLFRQSIAKQIGASDPAVGLAARSCQWLVLHTRDAGLGGSYGANVSERPDRLPLERWH